MPAGWLQPGAFPSLQNLSIGNNPLGGSLPNLTAWHGMQALTSLLAPSTGLSGDIGR